MCLRRIQDRGLHGPKFDKKFLCKSKNFWERKNNFIEGVEGASPLDPPEEVRLQKKAAEAASPQAPPQTRVENTGDPGGEHNSMLQRFQREDGKKLIFTNAKFSKKNSTSHGNTKVSKILKVKRLCDFGVGRDVYLLRMQRLTRRTMLLMPFTPRPCACPFLQESCNLSTLAPSTVRVGSAWLDRTTVQ